MKLITRPSFPRSWFLGVLSCVALLVGTARADAQTYHWSVLAGKPTAGATDGALGQANFNFPWGVAVDASGNAFVGDTQNNTIRKITAGGVTTTLAGTPGIRASVDGTGAAARFDRPAGVALGSDGSLYVAGNFEHTIRKITSGGVVTTFAGSAYLAAGTDGTGSAARFAGPVGIAIDGSDNIYVAEAGNHTIRKITPGGVVTTLAGSAGISGSTDGTGAAARFNSPWSIAVTPDGSTLYVTDAGNHTIRQVTSAGVVTTLAGTAGQTGTTNDIGAAARFSSPRGITLDNAGTSLYVTESGNHLLRKIDLATAAVTTVAGTAGQGGFGSSIMNAPYGVSRDPSNSSRLLMTETGNNMVRNVTTVGVMTIFAGLNANIAPAPAPTTRVSGIRAAWR